MIQTLDQKFRGIALGLEIEKAKIEKQLKLVNS